jgi:DNA-binding MarR family transcriptional regulator
MSDLADEFACHASNITGIVDRLELRGLVERRPSTEDRRVKHIALTNGGSALRERLLHRLHEPPTPTSGLSESDQIALRDILRRVIHQE